MNLHGTVSGAIAAVNPFIPATIIRNTGYTTAPDGKRTPTTETITTELQFQNLNAQQLRQYEYLNLQTDAGAVFLNGSFDGVVRTDRKGGDIFEFNGKRWLAVQVMEQWPDWCKILVCLQV